MSRYIRKGLGRPAAHVLAVAAVSNLLISCAKIELAPHLRPLSKDAVMLLGKKGMDVQAPLFIRIYKEESELEVWKLRQDGRYYHYKTYPICTGPASWARS
jgi:murein L,D-transpeptidase YafK